MNLERAVELAVQAIQLVGQQHRGHVRGPCLTCREAEEAIPVLEALDAIISCTRCDKPIHGAMVGDGDGTGQRFAHKKCYDADVSSVTTRTLDTITCLECMDKGKIVSGQMGFKTTRTCHHCEKGIAMAARGALSKDGSNLKDQSARKCLCSTVHDHTGVHKVVPNYCPIHGSSYEHE